MKSLVLVACLLLTACASQRSLADVSKAESARMPKTSKPLSSFKDYELKPLVLSAELQGDTSKSAAAATLEQKLKEKIDPLLVQWRSAPGGERSGTLVIEPQLANLRIVSGGARFWVGGMAGDSTIDMDLQLTEQGSNATIAKVRVGRTAGGQSGGWTVGKSDRDLYLYVSAIAGQYLQDNY